MKIVICEDEEFWIDSLIASIDQWANTRSIEPSYHNFSSPHALIEFLKNETEIDVVFLDISFVNEALDGMNAAKQIRDMGNKVPIIFVTVDSLRAVDGYLVEAMGFLCKPIDTRRLTLFLDRILDNQKSNRSAEVQTNRGIVTLWQHEIIYVEVFNHTLTYHMADSKVECRGSLNEMFSLWDSEHFIRIHRAYAISKDKIYNIKATYPYSVNLMKGDELITLSVSRKYIDNLLEVYSADILGRII